MGQGPLKSTSHNFHIDVIKQKIVKGWKLH